MNGFLRTTFTRQKFQGLFISTAVGNFAAYVAGSLVTLASTRQVFEQRGITNLFGLLPRKKIVVHLLPHWLEWLLALVVGFLVMEAVRYCFNNLRHTALNQRRFPAGPPAVMSAVAPLAAQRNGMPAGPSRDSRVNASQTRPALENSSVAARQASTRLEQLVQYMRDRAGRPR